MYVYVAKYKYGHMCTTCMTLSTSRVIHIYVHIQYMYVYVAKYKYGHMCTTCMTLSTCRVTRVIHTCMHMYMFVHLHLCTILE